MQSVSFRLDPGYASTSAFSDSLSAPGFWGWSCSFSCPEHKRLNFLVEVKKSPSRVLTDGIGGCQPLNFGQICCHDQFHRLRFLSLMLFTAFCFTSSPSSSLHFLIRPASVTPFRWLFPRCAHFFVITSPECGSWRAAANATVDHPATYVQYDQANACRLHPTRLTAPHENSLALCDIACTSSRASTWFLCQCSSPGKPDLTLSLCATLVFPPIHVLEP